MFQQSTASLRWFSLFARTLSQRSVTTRGRCRVCSSVSQPCFGAVKSTTAGSQFSDPDGFDGAPCGETQLNERILRIKTVLGQMKIFENFRNSPYMKQFNRAAILCSVARSIRDDNKQSQLLDYKQGDQSSHSALLFKDLLDCLLENISSSGPYNLARIIWALGKLQVDHPLFDVCEGAILNSGITVFKSSSICQIATGISSRFKSGSMVLREIEKGILMGQIRIADFNDEEFAGVLHSFARADQGSVALFEHLLAICLTKDFSKLGYLVLATFVWSFAKKGLSSEQLGELVKGEINQRGTSNMKRAELNMFLWAFVTDSGSETLFARFDKELTLRGVTDFETAELVQIAWSFAKRQMRRAMVFDLVEEEISRRGLTGLKDHQLSLLLWSFVEAKRPSSELFDRIKQEFLSRDVTGFTDSVLCQFATSFGKGEICTAEVLDSIQRELFSRSSRGLPIFSVIVFLRGFVEAKRTNKEFVEQMEVVLLESDFSGLDVDGAVELLALLATIRLRSPLIYDTIERNIFNMDKSTFSKNHVESIASSFSNANEGSQQLFDLLKSASHQ